jgi:glycosyltransferase involved in cell wall biosynthesis
VRRSPHPGLPPQGGKGLSDEDQPRLRRLIVDGLPLQVQSAGIAVYTEGLVRALARERPDLDIGLLGLSRLLRVLLRARPLAGAPAAWPERVTWIESSWYPALMGYLSRSGIRLGSVEAIAGAADVFHATNYGAPRRRAARLVVTMHDLTLLRFPELGTAALRAHVAWACAGLPAADRIIADSQATRDDLVALTGADPARIRVVYPGCDERFTPLPRDAARAVVARRFDLRDPYILHVGTLEPRKNAVALLRAFERLRAGRATNHTLVLVGRRGWMYEPILAALRAPGLGGRVRLIDDADNDVLPALYSAAELFVYPSLYEGFGLPVVEAMACGTPVVTSTTSSLPEVAGDAALLADPRDADALAAAIERALGDPDLRAALAARGRTRARHFSWQRCARETLAVYEEALRSPPQR